MLGKRDREWHATKVTSPPWAKTLPVDILGAQRMITNDFGDPLIFLPVAKSSLLLYYKMFKNNEHEICWAQSKKQSKSIKEENMGDHIWYWPLNCRLEKLWTGMVILNEEEGRIFSVISCLYLLVESNPTTLPGSPALLSLQQLPVGGDLDIQGQLDVEKVLVLLQVSGHLLLQRVDVLLQTAHCILVTRSLHGEAVLHLPELAFQRLVLKEKRQDKVDGSQHHSTN